MLLLVLLVFVFGLVWGSFLNVVIYRTTHGTSPLSGRSQCPYCKKVISWKYNIPILSFFLLHGKCVNCGKKISWQYPLVEFLTGTLFVWWFFMGQGFFALSGQPWNILQPLFWLVVAMLLLVIFFADLLFGLIPDTVNLLLLLTVFFYRLGLTRFGAMQLPDFYLAVIAGLALLVFFGALWFFTKGKGFGLGDVKLAPSLGLLLGWPRVVPGIFAAFIIGAALGLGLIFLGKKKLKQSLPFGPFLVVGVVIGLVWGNWLWGWYWGLL